MQILHFNWLPWQRPLGNRQMNAGFIKPLHSSTKPWKIGEDLFSISCDLFAHRLTIKILLKFKKN